MPINLDAVLGLYLSQKNFFTDFLLALSA